MKRSRLGIAGTLYGRATFDGDPDRIKLAGVEDASVEREGDLWVARFQRHNAFVNQGLNILLDRLMGTNGPPGAISHMAVSDDDQAVSAGTVQINPGGGGSNATIVAVTNKVAASGQEASADGTFTEANADFAHKKVGFLNTASDAGTGLIDVIGGTGGSAPYDEPFTVDFTSASVFSVTYTIKLTATAV